MILVERATTRHALMMSPHLREADRREMMALGFNPICGLIDMVERSTVAWAGVEDGMPFAMGGAHVPNLLGNVAYPWMWTAHPAERLARHVLRFSRGFLDDLRGQYGRLETYVDPEYAGARRLLRSIGFTEEGIAMVGGNRMLRMGIG